MGFLSGTKQSKNIYKGAFHLIEYTSIELVRRIWRKSTRKKARGKYDFFMQSKCRYKILSFCEKRIDTAQD